MPNLFIRYGDIVLHDDDVDELDFTDAPGRVAVTGRLSAPKPAATGAGLLDLLAGARKAHTRQIVEEKRRDLDDDVKVPQHAAEVIDND